jgi:gas vesicle protein
MANTKAGSFFWGVVLGGAAGFAIGNYLSTEAGKQSLDTLRSRTVELTGDPEDLRKRATSAANTVRGAVTDALQEGIGAAKQRRRDATGRSSEPIRPDA